CHRRSRAGRWRRAARDVRVRRDPALPRGENRPADSDESTGAARLRAVAFLADGEPWADGWAEPPFRSIRTGETAVRDRSLRERDGPIVRSAEPATGRPRVYRWPLLDRRHRELSLGAARAAEPEHE